MPHRSSMLRLSAAAVALAVVVSACGDSDTSAAPATSTSASTGAESNSAVSAILTEPASGRLAVDATSQPIMEVGLERADLGAGELDVMVGVTDDGSFVMVPVDLGAQAPTGDTFVVGLADGRQYQGTTDDLTPSADGFAFAGQLVNVLDGEAAELAFSLDFGAGTSVFSIDGNLATLTGSLGSNTFRQVEHLVAHHPEVDTLVLQFIDGSVNDEINVETGRLVRAAGLDTIVPADGEIYSGGVDLFAAGVHRIAEPGAVVGVHSWCCGPDGRTADELADDDPAHDSLIAYLEEMLGDELGRAFYFFTIDAAPFDGIHEMTGDELARFLATN